jgi:hypothetical protein
MLVGKLSHTIQVDPGSERVKVISNGGTLPFVGVTTYDITVKDAAGKEVGTAEASAASGTTSLDLDLHKLDTDPAKAAKRFGDLAFGKWTVDIGAVGTVTPPMDLGPADDAVEKRFITSLISVFGAQPKPCSTLTGFTPVTTKDYRFQDDKATGVAAFPANPEFTYVGPLPNGTLGNRAPERRLAATFGQATSTGKEPLFTTPPLAEPTTLGGSAQLRAFIQGPSEAVAGLLTGDLVDVDPNGAMSIIGQSPKDVAANASAAGPVETKVPIPVAAPHTVPAGHEIGIRIRLSFVGTSAHTLFYDSDKYPSGISIQMGQVITHEDCSHVIGTGPAPVNGSSGSGDGGQTPSAAPPATAPALPALPAAPALPAPPALVPALPALVPALPATPVTPPAAVVPAVPGTPVKAPTLPQLPSAAVPPALSKVLRLG